MVVGRGGVALTARNVPFLRITPGAIVVAATARIKEHGTSVPYDNYHAGDKTTHPLVMEFSDWFSTQRRESTLRNRKRAAAFWNHLVKTLSTDVYGIKSLSVYVHSHPLSRKTASKLVRGGVICYHPSVIRCYLITLV